MRIDMRMIMAMGSIAFFIDVSSTSRPPECQGETARPSVARGPTGTAPRK